MLAAMGDHTRTGKALIVGGADPNIQYRVSGSDCSTAGLCSNVLTLQSQPVHFLAYPFYRMSMYMYVYIITPYINVYSI